MPFLGSPKRKLELARARDQRYRAKHRERILKRRAEIIASETPERRAKRLAKQRLKDKAYYRRHRAAILAKRANIRMYKADVLNARRRHYYLKNAERERAYQRRRYSSNKDYYADYQRRRDQQFPERARAAANRRRALKAKAEGDFTEQEWLALRGLYSHRCAWCRKRKRLEADHIVPLSKGGSNLISNIQPLCKSCNSKKGTRTISLGLIDTGCKLLSMPVDKGPKGVEQDMRRFKHGNLHSGKGGPVVKSRKQAIAISLSEAGMSRKNKKGFKRS